MKRLILVVCLIAVVIGASAASFAETATLRVAWWGSQARHDQTLKVIDLFEKKYPDIEIKPEYTGWNGYFDKMAAEAAGGNLPDVMQHDIKYITQYVSSGLLVNLDPLVGKTLNLKDVKPSLLNDGRIDGKLYGINLGANTYVIMYDPEVFAKAKVKEPKSGWTWDDYMATCRKIHKAANIYAETSLSFTYRNITGLEHYVRQHGKKFFDGSKIGFDEKLFVDFYKMDVDLTKEGVVAPPEVRQELHTVENDLMVVRKSAMAGYWTNQIVAITKAAGRPIKMVLLPRVKRQVKEGTYLKPSMFFSITRDCKNQAAAAKFIDFFTNDVEANKVMMAERGVPVSTKVQKALGPFLEAPQKMMFDMVAYAATHSSAMDPPAPPQFNQIVDLLTDINMKILYGVVSLDQGAKEFIEKANAILAAK